MMGTSVRAPQHRRREGGSLSPSRFFPVSICEYIKLLVRSRYVRFVVSLGDEGCGALQRLIKVRRSLSEAMQDEARYVNCAWQQTLFTNDEAVLKSLRAWKRLESTYTEFEESFFESRGERENYSTPLKIT